ncbi:MAG: hypothetical protein M3525_03140 [Acidobacteriota bacterium]|nr:hypothetical protein [Acidobacteriota bacterium]
MQSKFADVLEAVEELLTDDKEELIRILNNRLVENRRNQLKHEIESAEREFEQGLCKSLTVDEFVQEVSS